MLLAPACRAGPDAPPRGKDSTRAEAAAPALESAAAAADTAGCELAPVGAHPDPDALLREFVRRDSAGQFTRASEWFDRAVDCPGHEPAPDEATMVRGYAVRVLGRDSAALRAEVRWERLMRGHAMDPGVDVDTLTVVHTPYGWRVRSPALRPKVPIPPPPPPPPPPAR